MDIPGWRRRIDEIDERILRLLNERAQCAFEIGKIKKERKLPVVSRDREDEIMQSIMTKNPGPLSEAQVREIFALIIEHSRNLQNNL